jgi:hypothetical protein
VAISSVFLFNSLFLLKQSIKLPFNSYQQPHPKSRPTAHHHHRSQIATDSTAHIIRAQPRALAEGRGAVHSCVHRVRFKLLLPGFTTTGPRCRSGPPRWACRPWTARCTAAAGTCTTHATRGVSRSVCFAMSRRLHRDVEALTRWPAPRSCRSWPAAASPPPGTRPRRYDARSGRRSG